MNKRLRDITREVPPGKIPIFLARNRDKIHNFLEQVKENKERNDENVLYFQCVEKAGQLIDHFRRAWFKDFLLGCVLTRCMFELDLLIRWFEVEPENRLKFYHSVLWEEYDLLKAFRRFDETGSKGEPLRERLEQLEALEEKHKLNQQRDRIKRIRWKTLAEKFKLSQDYETIYSLTSKILHISPYSVLRNISEKETEYNWKILLVMIQLFLGDLYTRIARFFDMTPAW